MKKILVFIILFFPCLSFGISVKQDTFGDIKISVTSSYSRADLVVYITDIHSLASQKEEIWEWVQVNPDLKVRITDISSASDIVVFFTQFRSQAGWKNNNHPLKGKLIP